MANNLRILYNNVATAVGGSSTAASLSDYKSQYQTGSSFTVTTSAISGPVAVIAVLVGDVGPVTMNANSAINTENTTSTISTTPMAGYGGVKYVAVYYTQASPTTSFSITFSRAVNVSRFIIGNYWSPKYNTSYGISVGYSDSSVKDRLQSGDQYITVMPRNKVMQFDLQYLDESEKFTLFDILRGISVTKPIFISAFPSDTYQDKEQMYSIYGRLSTPPNMSYHTYTMYASSLQFDEV